MSEQRNPIIGWIGTGVMGQAMCRHVLVGGHDVVVFNRTRDKADTLVAAGAVWCDSPAAVAARADIVFTMVGFPQDVHDVYLGADGVASTIAAGAVAVDMTTTSPSLWCRIAAELSERGVDALDAPVSGGDVGARTARLSIMVGGAEAAVRRVMPLFELMGRQIVHQGPPGAGQHAKMCNQIVIAGTMVGVCESLLYGQRAGLDLATMLESISGGAAACWTLDNLAPRILVGNFDPGFFVEHFIKDMGIALDEAVRMGLKLPGLALVHDLYQQVQAHGHGRCGTHALMKALEKLSS